MNNNDLQGVPPWLRHFLIHVVKRCAGILLQWIEEMQAVEKSN